jgi:hypothetical protein
LKHSRIQRFEKDTGDASTTNSIRKKTQRFTKHQTQRHTPVIHGRRGFAYTPLDKATDIAEVYEDQFGSDLEEDQFDNFCQQIGPKVAAFLQLHPVSLTTFSTPTQILPIIKLTTQKTDFRSR